MTQEKTERIIELFEELVPSSGKAASVAGELVRAANRIGYRYLNDGDMIGVDYGNETCNAAARYIKAHTDEHIAKDVDGMWGWSGSDEAYEVLVDMLCEKVARYVDGHPELRGVPTEDMWDHRHPEDSDWGEEEEWDDEGW